MSPRHHPSQELISSCVSGALRPGATLIVRAHLAACAACRRDAAFFESLGGALLEAEAPTEMSAGALARTLAAIEAPQLAATIVAGNSRDAATLPPGLTGLAVGKRRWVAPGVWVTPVQPKLRSRELVYLLGIGPGMVLPRHTHSGCEFTYVLEGSFSDATGRYEAGDFIALDETVEHKPVVAREGACVCLVSTDSPLVMRELLGRLFQPFAAI